MADKIIPFHSAYLKTFERACEAKQISPQELLAYLGMKRDGFINSLKRVSGPNLIELKQVCDYFDITIESFLTGFIDQNWISNPTLPEKYRFSAGSKFRTSMGILDYARRKQGDAFLQSILRTLKIPASFLENPNERVSILLLSDILKFLASRGFTYDDFVRMGWHSVSINANVAIGEKLKGLSPSAVFEKLFTEVILEYEENFDYQIVGSNSNSIQVRASPNRARVEDFKTDLIDNLFVSYYRHGACAAHLKPAGHDIAHSEFVSSIHLGHGEEEFRLSWA